MSIQNEVGRSSAPQKGFYSLGKALCLARGTGDIYSSHDVIVPMDYLPSAHLEL
jgi:hypothetical protein